MFSINDLREPLIDYYGEDKVEVTHNENEYKAIIWFPEAEISNEQGLTHTIYDVFIKLIFTEEGRLIRKFQLLRTTFTLQEINAKYIHSHTPRCTLYDLSWLDPCLGTSQSNYTVASLMAAFDSTSFNILLSQIDDFVHTESLEGGPYIRISAIKANTPIYLGEYYIEDFYMQPDYKNIIADFLKVYQYRVVYDGECYRLAVSNTQLALDLGDFIVNDINSQVETESAENSDIFVKEKILIRCIYTSGELYKSHPPFESDIPNKFIKFKGRKFRFKCENRDAVEGNAERYVANPQFTTTAKYLIEQYLNYA